MNKTLATSFALALALHTGVHHAATAQTQTAETVQHKAHSNPFFGDFNTPQNIAPFDRITIEDYRQAVKKGIEQQKKEVADIVNNRQRPTFENTIAALDQSGKLLYKVFMTFSPLSSSNSTAEFRTLQQEFSPLLSAHSDDIYLNPQLFARVKAVYNNKKAQRRLTHEQKSLLDKTYKNFVREGANLNDAQKTVLRELNTEIAQLQLQFSQNLMFETNNTFVTVDNVDELKGLSQDNIDRAATLAKAKGADGKWMFNMQRASCMPVLQYADNRDLRKKVYLAYVNRGNQGNQYDSKDLSRRIIELRIRKAKLMGFQDFAALILENRMAKESRAVYNLLNAVWTPAVAKAKEEIADIRAEIAREGGSFEPEGWDFMYYQNKAKQAKYAFNEAELSEYFEINNVLQGVFGVATRLYGITFKERTGEYPVYEPSAKAWDVYDRDGSLLAVFYSDYEPREGKRAGAWCTSFRAQDYVNNRRQAPVVVNVCSFTTPTAEKPALLTADEVTTLFHEFGHALHSFFRDVHYNGVGSVERDFVELPSQILEHWAFQPEVLKTYARHYRTGEVIPMDLVQKLEDSGKYGQGFATVEYVAAALVDMDLHTLTTLPENFDVMKFEADQLRQRGIPQQIQPRYRVTNFSHTMGGGYTAGYYSYLWAEVLDADGFEAFRETGNIFDPATAQKFRKYILTPGGIDDGMTMYTNFRGRQPAIDALLKNRGLK